MDELVLGLFCTTGLFWVPLYLLRGGSRATLGAIKQDTLIRFGGLVERIPLSPNGATLIDLWASVMGAYFIWDQRPIVGGVLFVLAALFDALDGLLARAKHQETERGAVLDFTVDRMSEFLLLAAVAAANMASPEMCITALFAGTLIVFNRVHGKALGIEGFDVTRTPRRELVVVGLLAGYTPEAVGAVALCALFNMSVELSMLLSRAKGAKTRL